MKRRLMMMVAGIASLASAGVARAQAPNTGAPPKGPSTSLPPTNPDVDEPASPTAPLQPGTLPPLMSAQSLPPPAPIAPVGAPVMAPVEGEAHPYPAFLHKVGTAVMLGGGYEDFSQSGPKNATAPGGAWNARLAAGTRQFIGLEAAYVGAARGVQVLGAATNTSLVSNGLEGALRINIPIVKGAALIEPFAFVGLGWEHYHLSKGFATADITNSDDVMTLPYGVGVMGVYGMFMLDARATWRDTFYNDMFRSSGSKLNTWGVGGNIGVEF